MRTMLQGDTWYNENLADFGDVKSNWMRNCFDWNRHEQSYKSKRLEDLLQSQENDRCGFCSAHLLFPYWSEIQFSFILNS